MVAPSDGPLSYEMRFRTTWLTVLAGIMFPAAGAVVVIAGGPRLYPVTISCAALFVVGVAIAHLRRYGRLLLRADERGIELWGSWCVFVAWRDVRDADISYSGEDRALVFQVARGSVVPLSERGERAARHINHPSGKQPARYAVLAVSRVHLLNRAALTAVIRTYAPHVTGEFGAG
ncbi:hypothetical protein [Kribbella italica]|uniref:PH domain-containing protein n=1 Tax=Kribbella italica TaxID=1540520 RepID=A0A7W9J193_9ACTN|nr:hypothetical protein [Kribbella italica]MBB5833781.1 hypothetical protein [Kribbella italica]